MPIINLIEKILTLFLPFIVKWFKKTAKKNKNNKSALNIAALLVYNIASLASTSFQSSDLFKDLMPDATDLQRTLIKNNILAIASSFNILVEKGIKDSDNLEDVIKIIAETMQELKETNPEQFAILAHNLSALFAVKIGNNLSIGDAFGLIEAVWQAITKQKVIPILQNQEITLVENISDDFEE